MWKHAFRKDNCFSFEAAEETVYLEREPVFWRENEVVGTRKEYTYTYVKVVAMVLKPQ